MNEITIVVSGKTRSGKSTVAKLIADTLRQHGAVIVVEDEPLSLAWHQENQQKARLKALVEENGLHVNIRTRNEDRP